MAFTDLALVCIFLFSACRAGYTPNDYPSETEWEGRLLLEKSDTVLNPLLPCSDAVCFTTFCDLANYNISLFALRGGISDGLGHNQHPNTD